MWQNGKVWHAGDALRCLSVSDLFEWPQRDVWGNDLWYVHLNFKLLVHKMVLLTSFHIFSIIRNFAKLKLYITGQNDFSIKVLRFSNKSFFIFRSQYTNNEKFIDIRITFWKFFYFSTISSYHKWKGTWLSDVNLRRGRWAKWTQFKHFLIFEILTVAESRAYKLSITNHLNSTVQGIISQPYNKLAFICTFPSISFDCITRTLTPCVCGFSLRLVLDFLLSTWTKWVIIYFGFG